MRRVYHGGIEIIEQPLVHIGRDNLDFGKGFFVTDVLKLAKTWDLTTRFVFSTKRLLKNT